MLTDGIDIYNPAGRTVAEVFKEVNEPYKLLGISENEYFKMIMGWTKITEDMAERLEKASNGLKKDFWLGLDELSRRKLENIREAVFDDLKEYVRLRNKLEQYNLGPLRADIYEPVVHLSYGAFFKLFDEYKLVGQNNILDKYMAEKDGVQYYTEVHNMWREEK